MSLQLTNKQVRHMFRVEYGSNSVHSHGRTLAHIVSLMRHVYRRCRAVGSQRGRNAGLPLSDGCLWNSRCPPLFCGGNDVCMDMDILLCAGDKRAGA